MPSDPWAAIQLRPLSWTPLRLQRESNGLSLRQLWNMRWGGGETTAEATPPVAAAATATVVVERETVMKHGGLAPTSVFLTLVNYSHPRLVGAGDRQLKETHQAQ